MKPSWRQNVKGCADQEGEKEGEGYGRHDRERFVNWEEGQTQSTGKCTDRMHNSHPGLVAQPAGVTRVPHP